MSADYGGTVEQVHRAFGDERYWLARLADSGVDDSSLDALDTGADGAVRIATTQVIRRDRLPGVAAQFIRGDLSIKREESWSPARDGSSTASVRASIPGAPVHVEGTAVLAGAPKGSTLTYKAAVEVKIPLVGGKLEGVIAAQLVDLVTAEQRFTTVWIAENA